MPAYDLRCKTCGKLTEVNVPMMQAPQEGRCSHCGGHAVRSYTFPQICTSTMADRFFGGCFWNTNAKEKLAQMREDDKRYEESWRPADNSDVRIERAVDEA